MLEIYWINSFGEIAFASIQTLCYMLTLFKLQKAGIWKTGCFVWQSYSWKFIQLWGGKKKGRKKLPADQNVTSAAPFHLSYKMHRLKKNTAQYDLQTVFYEFILLLAREQL